MSSNNNQQGNPNYWAERTPVGPDIQSQKRKSYKRYTAVIVVLVCVLIVSLAALVISMVFGGGNRTAYEKGSLQRIYGESRTETALEIAKAVGDKKLSTIILANGEDENLADALAGSYLANVKKAPILLYRTSGMSMQNYKFIAENLKTGGTVYLLGDEGVIPKEIEEILLATYQVKRIAGTTRFDTNLAILEEVGVTNEEILISRGYEFADGLSASAVGLPILLVNEENDTLTDAQIKFLKAHKQNRMTILGGTSGISEGLERTIEQIVGHDVARCAGATREETSVAIVERYFQKPDFVVVAYSGKAPDGLCGGPLAYKLGVPLLAVDAGKEYVAADYVAENGIESGYVLGSDVVLSDETIVNVFNLPRYTIIPAK